MNYDELYNRPFSKTSSYIRFSQTVEESIGCTYDMTEEDDEFLKSYNQKRPPSGQLSEDDFEKIMEVYEDTSYIKAPFASIDQTIVPYEEMLQGLQDLDKAKIMPHAKEIYEYWKSRRIALNNQPLHPTLKFERHQESDDTDPYVCFRRREVRQTRKTRARDVQSADKLKRLRRELEEGRQLVMAAHNRELLKAEMLKADRAIFEVRGRLKEIKVRLGIKTDDEDLINQKVGTSRMNPHSHAVVVLTFCSRKRGRPPMPLQYSGRRRQHNSASVPGQMADLPMAISHFLLIASLRRRMNSVPISRRRCRAIMNGIATTLTSQGVRSRQFMGQSRPPALGQLRRSI